MKALSWRRSLSQGKHPSMEKGLCKPQGEDPWRVLEFYSGIGGMVLSLSLSLSLHMCRCIYVFVIISVYLCVYVSIEILFKEGRCECENCGSIRHQQHCQRCLSTQFRSPPLPGFRLFPLQLLFAICRKTLFL